MFVIRFMSLNNKPYRLILVNWKIYFKIIRFLKFKDKVIIKVKVVIKKINNIFKRYLVYLYYNKGKEISRLRFYLRKKGIIFLKSSFYVYN